MAAILADGAGSGTIVLGEAIADWRTRDIANQAVVLNCNGVERRRGSAAEAIDHPLVPLTWLANELSRTGIGLKAGQTISTGTPDRHAAAEGGRNLRRRFRSVRNRERDLRLDEWTHAGGACQAAA